ncbi:neuronal acetylcholine receptor subunit alpha-7-like [Convolutriloba macropyga]|uniref:neuronal acetylcholine receptor subunit alpha-7-like n=1 Tax=Convolutriloba macropyga TaxID=536237 RepID=UPI003F523AEF
MLIKTFFVQFDLRQVLDVDQKNGLWFARVALDIYYISKSASWDPSEFNDIEYLTLPRGDIWSPDIVITNAIDTLYTANTDAFVHHLGIVSTRSSLVAVKLACSIDVTRFPFDEQTCDFRIGPVYNFQFHYFISYERDEAYLNFYVENDQWELIRPVKLYVERTITEEVSQQGIDEFVAQVRLRRRSLYYIIVLICPNLLLYLLSSLVFAVPVQSDDKLSFISTILLAEVVTVSTLNDILPESSLGFPIIAYFVIAVIVHLSLLCIVSVIVNKVAHTEKTPSLFVSKITSWIKLKQRRIVPITEIASQQSNQNSQTISVEQNQVGTTDIEAEQRAAKENQTSSGCFSEVSSQMTGVEDSEHVWKTFATILDRGFCLIHIIIQLTVVLVVYLQF